MLLPTSIAYIVGGVGGGVSLCLAGLSRSKLIASEDAKDACKTGAMLLGTVTLIAAIWLSLKTTTVILLEGAAPNISITRKKLVGESTIEATDVDHDRVILRIENGGSGAWIINLSTNTLKLKKIAYGPHGTDQEEPFEPGTAHQVYLDLLGPNDEPPASTKSLSRDGTYLHWLTW